MRLDPVRVAEEYATADVISRGRLEIGFVKSGLSEFASNQTNPVDNGERYWEAIDLISHALSRHDGVFSWEGKHFTHRHVNIWPRPYQDKLPRMWSATGAPSTAADVARHSSRFGTPPGPDTGWPGGRGGAASSTVRTGQLRLGKVRGGFF